MPRCHTRHQQVSGEVEIAETFMVYNLKVCNQTINALLQLCSTLKSEKNISPSNHQLKIGSPLYAFSHF